MTPEQQARQRIDKLLLDAGWITQDAGAASISAAVGVEIREFPLASGFGFADYLLYVDGSAVGVIEAKKAGVTLSGVEIQSDRYSQGLPQALPLWQRQEVQEVLSALSASREAPGTQKTPVIASRAKRGGSQA